MDGHALGAAQAVTTRHGAGAPQAFSFGGSFAPGAHQVSPSLLNDWKPATGVDRSLHVQGAALNGTGSASAGGFVSGDASQPPHMLIGIAAGQ